MTRLANDIQRCIGTSRSGQCEKRENCERYLQRFGGGEWTPVANTCEEFKGFIPAVEVGE